MKRLIYLLLFVAPFLSQSCAVKRSVAYPAFYSEPRPLSILIMPPINKTTNVDVSNVLYITMFQKVAERGYYVVPPFSAMEILKSEDAYDAEKHTFASLKKLRELTGADIVLFTNIIEWEKPNLPNVSVDLEVSGSGARVSNTSVRVSRKMNVSVEYIFRSTISNATIFQRTGSITYDTSVKSGLGGLGGAIADMTTSIISAAMLTNMQPANASNEIILSDLPAGRYRPNKHKDGKLRLGQTVNPAVKKFNNN